MSVRGLRNADSKTVLITFVTKAVRDWNLVEDGDRILVAVSGGKDSTALAFALSAARQAIQKNYELAALHISSDFCACCKKNALAAKLESWGIPFDDLFVPVIGRLKPGRKMNCYWCSTQRRTELLKYAQEKGFNKIALGHHMDDILETFFMNMMNKGEMTAMPVRLSYRKYPVSLIRPLAYLEEKQIIQFAKDADIMKAACTCPYGKNSERKTIRERIKAMTLDSGDIKRRMLKGLSSGAKDLLLDDSGD